MKKPTRVNHPPAVELPAGNHSVVAPIYQSVKFEFDTVEETERYFRGDRPEDRADGHDDVTKVEPLAEGRGNAHNSFAVHRGVGPTQSRREVDVTVREGR